MSSVTPQRAEPANYRELERRIKKYAEENGVPEKRIKTVVASTVSGQLMPDGVVKGGTAMKLRLGEAGSRFTPDFDAARRAGLSLEDYQFKLSENLEIGWKGFSGRVVEVKTYEPEGIPEDYIMRAFDIKLSYKEKSMLTLRFELGRDEIGSTESSPRFIASDIVDLFQELGLPQPLEVEVLSTEHQIAQKLHACTTPDRNHQNTRAHDLVDLQLLIESDPPDLIKLNEIGRRLFAARRLGTWPPEVIIFEKWEEIYNVEAEGLGLLGTVQEAIAWINGLLEEMVEATKNLNP